MSVAIVLLDSLQIPYVYGAPEPSQSSYGAEWGSPQITVHLEVPEGLDPQCIMATRDDSGKIVLTEDPIKLAQKTAAQWTALRTERNARLAASDWTQLQDSHISQDKKDAWAAYRQELRDLPDSVGSEGSGPPDLFSWPLKPGELPPVAPASSRLAALLDHADVVVETPVVQEVPEAVEKVPVVEEAEPVVETPVVEPVVETPVVQEAEPVVEVPVVQEAEPVVETPVAEVTEAEPVVETPVAEVTDP